MKKILSVLLALVLVFTLVACGNSAASTAPASGSAAADATSETGKQLTFALALDTIDSQYWVSIIGFVEKLAEENNVKLIQTVCEGDANKQNQQIEDLIAQGVDAILCGANDGASIAAAVQKCNDVGIPIIMLGRAIMSDTVTAPVEVLVDNTSLATDSVKWLNDQAIAKGVTYNIALFIGSLSDQNAIERYDGAKKAIEQYPDTMKLVAEIPTDWKPEQAFSGLQNALEKDSSINCIIAPSDFLFTTIQSVLEPLGKWVDRDDPNHTMIIGFDGDDGFAQMLMDGYVDASAVNDTQYMAETSFNWAMKLANGEAAPSDNKLLDPGLVAAYDNWDSVKERVWGYMALQK